MICYYADQNKLHSFDYFILKWIILLFKYLFIYNDLHFFAILSWITIVKTDILRTTCTFIRKFLKTMNNVNYPCTLKWYHKENNCVMTRNCVELMCNYREKHGHDFAFNKICLIPMCGNPVSWLIFYSDVVNLIFPSLETAFT